ncbi:hypothetical protein LCGC14_0757930 [marine sediment metagenome]|uniref:protein-glutamate O-methyltransferase n=1 Tax=marine sediment metagenome TaxID=412755 RepID=A0A0F9T936_9ZZZZ
MNLPIGKQTSIEALIEELKNATGMNFDYYQRKFLEKRIDFRMKYLNVEDYQDYINYIRRNPIEIDLFLDKFTINYTFFFRNLNVFQNFEKFIQFYIKKLGKNIRPIKIWSAPCATGDEPYSIAMVLDKLKKKEKIFPEFKIYASDIDTNAIKIAKDGFYGEYAVHDLPEHYLTTYFSKRITELGPKYLINNQIKEKVEFIQEDIIANHQLDQIYDVIFCRNFFIYINKQARDDFLKIIDNRLHNGGLLILGGSETLGNKHTVFESVHLRDRFYIKNLSKKHQTYKKGIYNLFEKKEITIIKQPLKKIKKTLVRKSTIDIRDKPKRVTTQIKDLEKELKKTKIKKEKSSKYIPEVERKEIAEVRFTKIVVNTNLNGALNNTENISLLEPEEIPVGKALISKIENREKSLKRRELILEQKNQNIEQKIKYIKDQYKVLEEERKKAEEILKNANEKETDVITRILVLERITRQIEQREKSVIQRELQLEKRLNQIEKYSRKMIQQEIEIHRYSNGAEKKTESEKGINSYDEQRIDRKKNPNDQRELIIPKGYYSLINSFDKSETAIKMIIKGLGAGIALILKDPINNIFAMSYISLPSSKASKQGYHLLFPHTFIDTSVNDLKNLLIYNGANRANIKALIVGGAKLFLNYDMTYQENIDAIKKELAAIQVEIEAEDIGGLSERSVLYDTINDSLFVKKTWEFEYRKIA